MPPHRRLSNDLNAILPFAWPCICALHVLYTELRVVRFVLLLRESSRLFIRRERMTSFNALSVCLCDAISIVDRDVHLLCLLASLDGVPQNPLDPLFFKERHFSTFLPL